ncbi:MAG: ribonuclease H-like domain-containing protein [Enterocloster sp.]
MITIKHPLDFPQTYPLERIGPLKELLFFDIETTGFSGDTSRLYLIGCAYHDGFGWKLIQWFADTRQSEAELLEAFFTFLKRFRILIHFNGDGFDIPYLLKCCRRLKLDYSFDGITSIDIYKKIKPYRRLLGLENMKQKSIEQFLGVSREDKYSGGQLIEVYRDYLTTHEKYLYDLLILHNEDDLKGMPSILPILNYADMLEAPMELTDCRLLSRESSRGSIPFLTMDWKSPFSIPVPLEHSCAPVSLELHEDHMTCSLDLYQGELKYFYPDYKDYYYLPFEDTAVHKSVGEYVDRSARKKATARTCYTRRDGLFLPRFSMNWEPALRKDYKDSFSYVPYDPALLARPDFCGDYARQILDYLREKPKDL